ncbi:unnamed protein product, partial [Mesorhabditis belari]|uniref:Major facilitator superfamily (MFS) profile domain-containing protein n=1 Tax=Mesorhabditis belari TaxID=2138241 RepID=A0AAF3FQT1_9BILA
MVKEEKTSSLSLRYYLTVFTVVLGGSSQFYSFCIVNQVQRVIMEWIETTYEARLDVELNEVTLHTIWSVIVGSLSIGALIGAFLVKTLSEKYGRKNTLLINGVLNVIGAAIVFLAKPFSLPELLVLGRFILGMNIGLTSGVIPLYLTELTPARHRAAAGGLHLIAVAFSNAFALFIGLPEILGSVEYWPFAFGLPGVLALSLCIILPFCPESPKFLLNNRGDTDGTRNVLMKIVGEAGVDAEFQVLLEETCDEEENHNGHLTDLCKSPDLHFPTLMAVLVMVAVQFSGLSAVMGYSTSMFINAKLDSSLARYATLGVGIMYFLSSCLAPFMVERLKRRSFYLFQRIASLACLICFTFFTGVQQYEHKEWASYGTITSLIIFMFLYGVGSPLPWIINLELFSQKYKSAGMSVSVFTVYGLAFLIMLFYLPFQQLVGVTFSYLPFITISTICCILLYKYLPETGDSETKEKPHPIRVSTRSLHYRMA